MMCSTHCWLGPVAVVRLQAHMLKFVQSVLWYLQYWVQNQLDLLGLFDRITERLKGLMEYVGEELLISIQGASRAYKER